MTSVSRRARICRWSPQRTGTPPNENQTSRNSQATSSFAGRLPEAGSRALCASSMLRRTER